MKLHSRVVLSIVAIAASLLFAAAMVHCVFECHEDDGEGGCGCFCNAGVSDLPAIHGLSFMLSPQSFVILSSESVDSILPSGVFRPPIA